MKLIIASLPDPCDEVVSKSLVSSAFHVTTIASTSGWLRKGMTTLLVGVQDKQIEKALAIIRKNCTEKGKSSGQHRSSIFVMKVNEYIHF